ncbi:unnamed protein product [Echinostoma caproni]|uniref:L27 domain-containing protein n=1 Tax=Echinostoma caproni TaxID=27848 RepID=A0A183AAL1_9TREM|nr:unnamed protein product [Echinostoma caproni]
MGMFDAWQLVSQGITDEDLIRRLLRHSQNKKNQLCDSDIVFLRAFLGNMQLKRCLELIDTTTSGASQQPLTREVRPPDGRERDSLKALSDLWVDLEQFVMQTRESDEPEAHELYDLLADPHIREVLVAYDDVANSRYYTEDFDLVPVYTESGPYGRRSASHSPVSTGSQKRGGTPTRSSKHQESLRNSQHEVHDDSLGEITVVSDLRSGNTTQNNRSPHSGAVDLSDQDDSDAQVSPITGLSSTKSSQHVRPDSTVGRVRRTSDFGSSHEVNRPESLKSHSSTKRSSKQQQEGFREKTTSLSRSGKRNNRHSQSDSDTSLTAVPKNDNPHLSSPSVSRRARDSSHTRDSNHPVQSPKSLTRQDSQTGKPPIAVIKPADSTPRENPYSPGVNSNSADLSRRDGNRKSSTNYPSASLPDRNQRHSKHSRSGETGPPVPETQSLARRPSRQSTRSSKDAREVRLPKPGEVRVIKLRRDHPGEPIGITIAVRTPSPPAQPNNSTKTEVINRSPPVLTIQRIMAGSLADRNGMYTVFLAYTFAPTPFPLELFAVIHTVNYVHSVRNYQRNIVLLATCFHP